MESRPRAVVSNDVLRKVILPRLQPVGKAQEIKPSNIAGSPYEYLMIWLTGAEHEGPHIIISDSRETEDERGWIIGFHEDYESSASYFVTAIVSAGAVSAAEAFATMWDVKHDDTLKRLRALSPDLLYEWLHGSAVTDSGKILADCLERGKDCPERQRNAAASE